MMENKKAVNEVRRAILALEKAKPSFLFIAISCVIFLPLGILLLILRAYASYKIFQAETKLLNFEG